MVSPATEAMPAVKPPEGGVEEEFKFSTDAKLMAEFLGVGGALVEEMRMVVRSDGLWLKEVDTSHVAMVEGGLPSNCFRSFHATGVAGEAVIAVEPKRLRATLKAFDPRGEVTFRRGRVEVAVGKSEKLYPDRLTLSCGALTRSLRTIPLTGFAEVRVPKLDLPGQVTLPTRGLLWALRECDRVSDHCAFTLDRDGLRIEADGEDGENVAVAFRRFDLTLLKVGETLSLRSVFPLDYLLAMVRAVPAGYVTLHMGQEYPMRIAFDLTGSGGWAQYLLAPRIESD